MGGGDAQRGFNYLIIPMENGTERVVNFGGKNAADVVKGTRIRIMTPGGGGYGKVEQGQE